VPRWLSILLKSTLTVGVLTALVVAVDPSALIASLQEAQWAWVAVALLLLPVNLALDGWVWKRLLDTISLRVSPRALLGAVLSGIALGFWTPARIGEFAGRSLFLRSGDRWTVSLTVFAQRMVDMAVGITVGFLALMGAFYNGLLPTTGAWMGAALIGFGTGTVLLICVRHPPLVHRGTKWLVGDRPGITKRTALFQHLSTKQGVSVVGGSFLRYFVFTGQFACLGLAFAPSASTELLGLAAALTFYAKYLIPSLTVLDLGIREGGAAFFFQQLGLGAAAGLNAALVLFAINVLVPALLGLPFVAGLQLTDVQETTQTPSTASVPGS